LLFSTTVVCYPMRKLKGLTMTASTPRLICFPHAGASAMTYNSWRPALASHLEVMIVDPPGRVGAADEAAGTTAELLSAVLERARPLVQQPYLLYGHSLGAVLAFETARQLTAEGRPPALLVVSGRNGPALRSPEDRLHDLPEEQFLQAVYAMDRSMSILRAEPSLAQLFLPVLRADLRMAEFYEYRDGALLTCPVLSIQGEDDPLVSRAGVAAWEAATTSRCVTHWMPGQHLFHLNGPDFVAALPQLISEVLSSPA
jgi:surfactin synthase thioesterase subunit